MDKIKTEILAQFGLSVLSILEEHEDWNSDTLQEIADVASELKLCIADEHGMFKSDI